MEYNLAFTRFPLPTFHYNHWNFWNYQQDIFREAPALASFPKSSPEQTHFIRNVILICLYAFSYHKINSENNYINMSCALTIIFTSD